MKLPRIGLLPRIILAIALGIALGNVLPLSIVRVFATFNGIFSQFLGFCIPLIILGLVSVAIAGIGRSAGRMLTLTVAIAYGMTLLSGFIAFGTAMLTFPDLIPDPATTDILGASTTDIAPYFSIGIPPLLDVMAALVLAFMLGLGMALLESKRLYEVSQDFERIISSVIAGVIIPVLPLYIFGIFLSMAHTGQVYGILSVFAQIIGIIFILHIGVLLFQYSLAGLITRRNPLRLLWTMLPAYFTALGTQSSAATIPVTLDRAKSCGVAPEVAGFVIPLCATIHLSGSTLKIVSCAVALMLMLGMPIDTMTFVGFIFMLGVTMIAAPGVPGGAIMACLGILGSILGFDEGAQALMIALYIAMDSFGTACNVTGDGAIALVVNQVTRAKANA